MNVFDRKDRSQVGVPQIVEVQDDILRTQRNDKGQEGDRREQNQETRSYQLPKTKWW